jgi:cytidylate kinase
VNESTTITAGLGGFIVFFALAVATWFLVRNMNARLRRMRYREEQEKLQAQEEQDRRDRREDEPGR